MNRRDLMSAGVAAVAVGAAATAFAQDEHAGHDHHHEADGATPAAAVPVRQTLIDSAFDCLKAGQLCLDHCLESFVAGTTALALCARSVDQMLAVCGALTKLAAANSPHLPAQATLAAAICDECEKECRKHSQHHATCKACAEACAACAEACRKV